MGRLDGHVPVRFPENLAAGARQCAAREGMSVSAWIRSLSMASNVFCRASVASCRINATPELPVPSPSNGAAYNRRKRCRG